MNLHPKILELTDKLFPLIAEFLKECNDLTSTVSEIMKLLKSKNITGLTFRGTFSYQVEYVLTNLIRRGLLNENGSFISLSIYGQTKIEKEETKIEASR